MVLPIQKTQHLFDNLYNIKCIILTLFIISSIFTEQSSYTITPDTLTSSPVTPQENLAGLVTEIKEYIIAGTTKKNLSLVKP